MSIVDLFNLTVELGLKIHLVNPLDYVHNPKVMSEHIKRVS